MHLRNPGRLLLACMQPVHLSRQHIAGRILFVHAACSAIKSRQAVMCPESQQLARESSCKDVAVLSPLQSCASQQRQSHSSSWTTQPAVTDGMERSSLDISSPCKPASRGERSSRREDGLCEAGASPGLNVATEKGILCPSSEGSLLGAEATYGGRLSPGKCQG